MKSNTIFVLCPTAPWVSEWFIPNFSNSFCTLLSIDEDIHPVYTRGFIGIGIAYIIFCNVSTVKLVCINSGNGLLTLWINITGRVAVGCEEQPRRTWNVLTGTTNSARRAIVIKNREATRVQCCNSHIVVSHIARGVFKY